MSFEDLNAFQNELERAQDELEKIQEQQEKPDDFGFSEVLKERQKHKDALRVRLEKQNFSEKEIEKLFKIISKAEEEMEKVKAKFDYKAKIPGSGLKLQKDLTDIQNIMKKEFDLEFYKILQSKKRK